MTSRNRRSERGNSLVEFAVTSSTLILAFSGAFQFGFAFYRYNMLESGVNAGARYASTRTYRCALGDTDVNANKTAVRNVVVYGTPAPNPNTPPVIPGLSGGAIEVNYTLSSTGVPVSVTVGLRSMNIDAVFTTFTLTGKPYVTFPFMGRYAPNESEP
jgi:Flp pilus assembly protein TadG